MIEEVRGIDRADSRMHAQLVGGLHRLGEQLVGGGGRHDAGKSIGRGHGGIGGNSLPDCIGETVAILSVKSYCCVFMQMETISNWCLVRL